jgi:glucose/arabinose dehydrogenase
VRLRHLALLGALAAITAISGAASADTVPFTVAPGFHADVIATVSRPRELAFAPNGDLIAGSLSGDVYVIAHAEDRPAHPEVYLHIDDAPAAGVAFDGDTLYVGTQHAVWRVAYQPHPAPRRIAEVRPGNGRDHVTTSVAISNGTLYASVGSSCDACTESDPTRATIQAMQPDGRSMRPKAIRIRNAIALSVNPQTGALWAGVAGQDHLPAGHPYEMFDPVSLHPGTVNYGWPVCYDNRSPIDPGTDCSLMTPARVVFPAYETPVGAAIYPLARRGTYAFPSEYQGGAFVTLHGSWHVPLVPPRVVFVPLRGDEPVTAVNWNDPNAQWHEFMGGFQNMLGYRSGRPTGITVGPQGSLFVADDNASAIYRIRPN